MKLTHGVAALALVFMCTGCQAMAAYMPAALRPLAGIIKDPKWVKGDCQDELRRRNVFGLCSRAALAKTRRPQNPLAVTDAILGDARNQMESKLRSFLLRLVNACASQCGNLHTLPRVDLMARLSASVLRSARVADTWLAGNDTLYGLVVIDVDGFIKAINSHADLDEVAKQELIRRSREGLR